MVITFSFYAFPFSIQFYVPFVWNFAKYREW
jgi:hypothetical protein